LLAQQECHYRLELKCFIHSMVKYEHSILHSILQPTMPVLPILKCRKKTLKSRHRFGKFPINAIRKEMNTSVRITLNILVISIAIAGGFYHILARSLASLGYLRNVICFEGCSYTIRLSREAREGSQSYPILSYGLKANTIYSKTRSNIKYVTGLCTPVPGEDG